MDEKPNIYAPVASELARDRLDCRFPGARKRRLRSVDHVRCFGGAAGSATDPIVDGCEPNGVALDRQGNLYGTCSVGGGARNCGSVWKVSAGNSGYQILHSFGGELQSNRGGTRLDGINPAFPPVVDSTGNLYGGSSQGGLHNAGMLWMLANTGRYLDLHDFGGQFTDRNGSVVPDAAGDCPLSIDASGALYGVAVNGGLDGLGFIFTLTRSGVYADLSDLPYFQTGYSVVCVDPSGSLFGEASFGGTLNEGVLWALRPLQMGSSGKP